MDVIEKKVTAYIADAQSFQPGGTERAVGAPILQDGTVDWIKLLELVLFIEETFGIQVSDEDMTPENFGSVENIVQVIRARQRD